MTTMLRELWAIAADAIFGPRCVLGCGQRLYPRDQFDHWRTDHGGDAWPLEWPLPGDRA